MRTLDKLLAKRRRANDSWRKTDDRPLYSFNEVTASYSMTAAQFAAIAERLHLSDGELIELLRRA